MPNRKNSRTERKIGILEKFLDETKDIGWFLGILDSTFTEFGYRGMTSREPVKALKRITRNLRGTAADEQELRNKHDEMMWTGEFDDQDEWDYISELAKETRKMKGLEEDAHVTLRDGSAEWKAASKKVIGKRDGFLKMKRGIVDKNYALDMLENLTRMRVNAYSQISESAELFTDYLRLARENYAASFTSGSGESQDRLLEAIYKMIYYVSRFSSNELKLKKVYPKIFLDGKAT